ncbi:MAG: LD-carboxypeptidase, partial [Limnohabitans sp.]
MAHIYVFSPSSAVRDKAAFRRGVRRLQAMGHEVELDPAVLASHMRFAGDDATRMAAIGRAAASAADIALISRGGYGLTRILPGLPYKAMARAIERGTHFVGLSDFTALNLSMLTRTGRITWQGPALGEDFGPASAPDDIMQACFDDLLAGQGEGAGWQRPATEAVIQTRVRDAVLWGGNLTVLCSMLGTPFFPAIDQGVLFLEDVGEHPYRIEHRTVRLPPQSTASRTRVWITASVAGRCQPAPSPCP